MLEPYSDRLTRLGLGLAAIGTLAWFLWPSAGWRLEPEPAVAFGTALALWLAAEFRSLVRSNAHPHDVAFIRELRSIISLDAIRYLQGHDFGGTYDNERLDGFWKIDFEAHTKGYGPHDRTLLKEFRAFRDKIREFSLLLATNGGPIGVSPRLCTIVPDQERAIDDFSSRTMKLVKQANDMADEIVRLHENLLHIARRRVPDAFGEQQ